MLWYVMIWYDERESMRMYAMVWNSNAMLWDFKAMVYVGKDMLDQTVRYVKCA